MNVDNTPAHLAQMLIKAVLVAEEKTAFGFNGQGTPADREYLLKVARECSLAVAPLVRSA